jgi:hypothetical protein
MDAVTGLVFGTTDDRDVVSDSSAAVAEGYRATSLMFLIYARRSCRSVSGTASPSVLPGGRRPSRGAFEKNWNKSTALSMRS